MAEFDVVIVGGGPAGAACAYDLVKAGKKVLILEKDVFPRFKACAGMLTMKALMRLQYSVAPVVQWSTDSMEISREFKAAKTLQASNNIVVTTVRSELDDFCLKQALAQGAELKVSSKGFNRYEEKSDGTIDVFFDQQSVSCKFLVGADGAHSKVRKQSGQFTPDRTAVALEGRVPFERIKNAAPKLVFDFNVAKKGYGWLIPKGDHINVGLYTRRPDEHPISKKLLQDYTERTLGTREIDDLIGFPVGTGGEYFYPAKGNVLLVGDAAGYAEPIFGEGIHNAIKSGRAAAQAIVLTQSDSRSAGEIYKETVEAVRTDVWWCRQIARAYYKFIVLAMAVLKRRPIRTAVMEGFANNLTIKECLKDLSPFHSAPHYETSATARDLAEKRVS